MGLYKLKDGSVIKLDFVYKVGPLHISKMDDKFSCYDIHFIDGSFETIFEGDIPRKKFIKHLKKGRKTFW